MFYLTTHSTHFFNGYMASDNETPNQAKQFYFWLLLILLYKLCKDKKKYNNNK